MVGGRAERSKRRKVSASARSTVRAMDEPAFAFELLIQTDASATGKKDAASRWEVTRGSVGSK